MRFFSPRIGMVADFNVFRFLIKITQGRGLLFLTDIIQHFKARSVMGAPSRVRYSGR